MVLNEKVLSFIKGHCHHGFEPFYIYDKDIIKNNCRNFSSLDYEPISIHFATMANIHPEFLKIVKEEGIKVFVNSLQHLEIVQSSGFTKEEIIFTASAMNEKTMRMAHEQGVQVNLDSPSQLRQWVSLFPNTSVGIRCNIGDNVKPFDNHAGSFIGKESRLGFTEEEMNAIEDKSKVKGLHVYVGTDILDLEYFINCYRILTQKTLMFPELTYLNFGGGFGMAENGQKSFDFTLYNEKVTQLMTETSTAYGKPLKLILEPGRIIGGEAGFFVCGVSDVKKRGRQILAGVNASTVQFSRPLMYPDTAHHPVIAFRNVDLINKPPLFDTTVYGCSTYSRDIFRKNVILPEVMINDVLIFGQAGSYSASSHSSFLGFPKPDEYFI